jgi:hypothetical protein
VLLLLLLPDWAASSALSIKASNELIVGYRASNKTNVFEYLGIPFAQPQVGSLRFAPPEKYQWSINSRILLAAKSVSLSILNCHLEVLLIYLLFEVKVKLQAFLLEQLTLKKASDWPQNTSGPVIYHWPPLKNF